MRLRAWLPALLCVVLTACPAVLGAAAARADSIAEQKQSVDQQIADVKEALEGASQDVVDAAVALQGAQARLAAARATLAKAQADLAEAARRDRQLAGELAFAQAQVDTATQEQVVRSAQIDRTRVAVGRLAREAYVGNGFSGLALALQSVSPEQFDERTSIAGVALRAQNQTLSQLLSQEADLRADAAKLDAARQRAAELKSRWEVVVARRAAAQQVASAQEQQVATLVAQEGTHLAVVRSKMAAEKDRLATLEAEQAKLAAMLAARAKAERERRRARPGGGGGGAAVPVPASGGFLAYAAAGPITSRFGMRFHPVLHIYRMHTGVDYGIDCGTPVHAAAAGDVVDAGPAGGYGNRVVIDHGTVGGGDLATTYNHLSRIVVSGGHVERGQLIAYSGTTGLSTGCHLHFETLLDGRFVDPMSYL